MDRFCERCECRPGENSSVEDEQLERCNRRAGSGFPGESWIYHEEELSSEQDCSLDRGDVILELR